jgi:hypothetical protein
MFKLTFETYINKKILNNLEKLFDKNQFIKNIFHYKDSNEILSIYEYTENYTEIPFKRYIFYYDIVLENENETLTKEYLVETIKIVKKLTDIYDSFDSFTSKELIKQFKILIDNIN